MSGPMVATETEKLKIHRAEATEYDLPRHI
jgi:hypothetical protein